MTCMAYQKKLRVFSEVVGTLAPNVYHYHRRQKDFPCIVWQEDGGSAFHADDARKEISPTGTLDYFTREEFDPRVDEIEAAFYQMNVSFSLNSVQYEEDTGLIHYEWVWEW